MANWVNWAPDFRSPSWLKTSPVNAKGPILSFFLQEYPNIVSGEDGVFEKRVTKCIEKRVN